MTEVRKHRRVTVSGKMTTVRHHTRGGEKTRREDEAEASREAWADRAAPHVSTLGGETEPQPEEWWAGDDEPPAGEFWDDGAADGDDEPEHSPAFAAMLRQNPDLGRGYDRLREQREAGYTGPIDQDGNPASAQAEPKTAKELRREAREAERAEQRAKLEKWEADMRADAERRGLPAYRPIGTKASWWRKRG